MGLLIPLEKNRSQGEGKEVMECTSMVRTNGSLTSWFSMVPVVV